VIFSEIHWSLQHWQLRRMRDTHTPQLSNTRKFYQRILKTFTSNIFTNEHKDQCNAGWWKLVTRYVQTLCIGFIRIWQKEDVHGPSVTWSNASWFPSLELRKYSVKWKIKVLQYVRQRIQNVWAMAQPHVPMRIRKNDFLCECGKMAAIWIT